MQKHQAKVNGDKASGGAGKAKAAPIEGGGRDKKKKKDDAKPPEVAAIAEQPGAKGKAKPAPKAKKLAAGDAVAAISDEVMSLGDQLDSAGSRVRRVPNTV